MKMILNINSSARQKGSLSREVSAQLVTRLREKYVDSKVTTRDASTDAEFLTEDWIGASFTPPEERSADQNQRLAVSNRLANEVMDADILVIGVSMYNFGLPGTLKTWIDQIARPGITFRPDQETGYVGLATGKTAYVVIATGETPVGGEMDYISHYLRHVLGFLGIDDVHIIAADMTVTDPSTVLQRAINQLDSLI